MATTPFTAAREAALKETLQSGKLALLKQWVDAPLFYCCISGTTVGVAKNPVAVLELLDRVLCVGVAFNLDFSGSWSPSDTLAGTPYTIHWGDGGTTNGNFPNPRNAALEFEPYTYAAAGTYNIVMEVQDSLGATGVAQLQVEAVNCPYAPPLPLPFPRYGGVVVGTEDQGVFFTDDITLGASTVWADLQSDELVGTGGKTVRGLCLYQPNEYHRERLYAATDCAIYEYDCLPPGCSHWQLLVDLTTINNYFGHGLTEVDFFQIRMSNETGHEGWGYCVFWGAINAGVPSSLYLIHTRDYWQSIHRGARVHTGGHYFYGSRGCYCSVIPGTNDASVMVVGSVWGMAPFDGTRCFEVTNYCTNVFIRDGPFGADECTCWVARNDPDYWYYHYNPGMRFTSNGGALFNGVGAARSANAGMFGPRDQANYVNMLGYTYMWQFTHGDVVTSTWGLNWEHPGVPGTGGRAYDWMVLFRELTGEPAIAVRVGGDAGVPVGPVVNVETATTHTAATGNLLTVMGANKPVLCVAKWEDGAGWS